MIAPAMAGMHPDAELIELGARFEPLVDRYYVARRRWSAALVQAHAEHYAEFGDPADRNFEYPPEITNAFADSCERSGAHTAGEALDAIFKEMAPLANAINAASVTSIEGFRAKALVAFWEVAPLGAGDSEFTFDDAWPHRVEGGHGDQRMWVIGIEDLIINKRAVGRPTDLADVERLERRQRRAR